MRGKSIKKLRICFETASIQDMFDAVGAARNIVQLEYGPLNFHWRDGDTFSPLEVLVWNGNVPYDFFDTQCYIWARCMNWSKLRSLDLGHYMSWLHLFQHLA
jgi:hypothetical protein